MYSFTVILVVVMEMGVFIPQKCNIYIYIYIYIYIFVYELIAIH